MEKHVLSTVHNGHMERGYLTPKRVAMENRETVQTSDSGAFINVFAQTPQREIHEVRVVAEDSFHTPSSSFEIVTPVRSGLIFTESGYTPSPEQGVLHDHQFWTPHSTQASPDTPVRRASPPGRTLLVERLPAMHQNISTIILTPERQPLDFMSPDRNCRTQPETGKRGRPRADMVTNLILEGSQSGNAIKCHICSRVFPREKSLQAHLRTHTGERPYRCDYPGCSRAFTQSGQLKTHQRLHAGEKPFMCSVEGCTNRYTHANRTCPEHPFAKPKRIAELILQPVISASEDQGQVYAWLQKYRREREEKTPGKIGEEEETIGHNEEEVKMKSKRGLANEMEHAYGQENVPTSPPRSEISRSKLTAQETFNQALLRAGERLERNSFKVHNLASQASRVTEGATGFKSILEGHLLDQASPVKALRRSMEDSSPMKGVRMTLGEITPSKNCKADNAANLDLELPFNFDLPFPSSVERLPMLPTTPRPLEKSQVLLFPTTPLPQEKTFNPLSPGLTNSPGLQGSPALKLKKRFQERFQEEKLQERTAGFCMEQALAHPISWAEEDDSSRYSHLLSTPLRGDLTPSSRERTSSGGTWTPSLRERTSSPTILAATALVELHDSPTRLPNPNQDLPLNLTKKSHH